VAGTTGATGPQGPTGPTGPQGSQGLPGGNISGSVANFASLPLAASVPDEAYVVLSPAPSHLWLSDGATWGDMGQFQGPTGLTGAAGTAGATGATGPTGATGITGAAGPTGPTGPQGIQGVQGVQGTTGAAGPGIAAGGTTGQWIKKNSATNYDTAWSTIAIADVSGLTTSLAAKIDNTSTVIVRSEMATTFIPKPALVRSRQEPYSIFEFGNGSTMSKGEEERAKAESAADFTSVIQLAAQSGEKVYWPRYNYPMRGRINLQSFNTPINWDIHTASRIKAGMQLHNTGVPNPIFTFSGSNGFDWNFANFLPLKIHGGIFDMVDLTAAYGDVTVGNVPPSNTSVMRNFGVSWFDLFRCTPDMDVAFDCGAANRVPGTGGLMDSGQGYLDSGISDHLCYGARYRVRGNGSKDALVYLSGELQTVTLPTDPFTTSGSQPTWVSVNAPAHGLKVGQYVSFNKSPPAVVGGITINGPYQVNTVINANAFRVISSTSASGAATGGGSGILMTPQIWDEYSQVAGSNAYVTGWAYRCNGFVSSKRQFIDLTVENARITECEGGVFGGSTGTPPSLSSQGHRFVVRNFKAKRTQGRPLAFYGSADVFLSDIVVEDFGGYISTQNAAKVTLMAISDRIGAVELQSCIQSRVRNVKARQLDNWDGLVPLATDTTPLYPAACVVGKSADYTWGTELAHVHTLVSVNCDRDIVDTATCKDNFFELVRTVGNNNPTSVVGPGSRVTRFPSGAQDP